MVTESYPNMISEMGIRSIGKGSSNNYSEELAILLREKATQLAASDQELRLLRSGSAPPTVEGSLSSDLFGYFYENGNLNPRLPRPSLSYGDGQVAQQMHGGGGACTGGDRRRMSGDGIGGGGESLFSMQPDFGMIQDDISNTSSGSRHPSRPASRAFENDESSESHAANYHEIESSIAKGASTLHSVKPLAAHVPNVGGRMMSSLMDRTSVDTPTSFDDVSPLISHTTNLVTALSGMSLSANSMIANEKHSYSRLEIDGAAVKNSPYLNKSMQYYSKSSTNSFLNSGRSPSSQYLNTDAFNSPLSNHGFGGFAINPSSPPILGNQLGIGNFPHFVENIGASGVNSRAVGEGLRLGADLLAAGFELHNPGRVGNLSEEDALHMAMMDPSYLQYLRSHVELQKSQCDPAFGKTRNLSHGFYRHPAFAPGMSYPGSPIGDLVVHNLPFGSGSPIMQGEQVMHFPSGLMNIPGSLMGGNLEESLASSLLYDFKSNKTKCFELAEIAGHVVEFSADQYGSRFIQQKLETATVQEKNMVFHEIMPHGLSLMTDVFGNYVIQKFFEHGSSSQIRQLAEQLMGHVLNLSLQMYGCRVIQKAIEVIELDQQTRIIAELDGHVMPCVRDQNGNHVIQKCIECVPEDVIDFLITTFYHQVVTLSTHPYGCRVVQRILKHCHNPQTQSMVMDEILQSVCMLAQDQYGNYVIQHVLEHGKPQERSAIISQLIGKIVPMSQQKYASNVVEKCLSFGTPGERQALVNEILGTTDENESLQVMTKDQFANYVVQKMLETCDDQQLELILNRIKVHLSALKQYTYGKHIVARVEKLVATGEKRISGLSLSSA